MQTYDVSLWRSLLRGLSMKRDGCTKQPVGVHVLDVLCAFFYWNQEYLVSLQEGKISIPHSTFRAC